MKVVHQLMSSHSTHPIDNKAIVKSLMDSVALLGHTNCELVQQRRDLIRPDLNDEYQQICSEHILFSSWLFGDDLPKQVQDISATNRVSQQLSSSRHNDRQRLSPADRRVTLGDSITQIFGRAGSGRNLLTRTRGTIRNK